MIIAINAVGNAPAKIIDVPSVALVPRIMISPRPPAPTNAPIAVIPMATTNAFATVKDEFEKRYDQTWFPSYGFENTYVFLVRKDTAQKYHLSKVSDLKNVADELVAGVDTSWINRKGDGYDGFQETYGFSFNSILPMQIGLVYDAVEAGKMDIVLGYSTDGRIASYDLVMLEDDRQFFPPYDAAPVVDNKILADTPHLKEALNKLGHTISTEKMQELNYEADNNLVEPSVVAQRFLQENHYFEGK